MHFKNSKLGTASSSFYLYGFTVHIKLTKIGHGLITNKSSEYYNYFSLISTQFHVINTVFRQRVFIKMSQ